MNWGIRITLLYVGFFVFIMTMVFLATGEKFHLVTEDYYEQEKNQDKMLGAMRNYRDLDQELKVSWESGAKKLILSFPEKAKPTQGDVWVYCPTDSKKDFLIALNESGEILQEISNSDLKSGRYKVKVSWESGQENYFSESTLFVP